MAPQRRRPRLIMTQFLNFSENMVVLPIDLLPGDIEDRPGITGCYYEETAYQSRPPTQGPSFIPQKIKKPRKSMAVVQDKTPIDSACDNSRQLSDLDTSTSGKMHYYHAYDKEDMLYGWTARADDYKSPGIFGEFLQKKGDLKSVADLQAEEKNQMSKLVDNLTNEIEVKTKCIKAFEGRFEELEDLDAMNQFLIAKERQTNNELQEAQKELIQGLMEKTSRTSIGVKKMGDLDAAALQEVANRKPLVLEADVKAMELCSQWKNQLEDPSWHPFKIVEVEGGKEHKEILNSDDEKLKLLKDQLGDKAYEAVTTALKEMKEYDPS